MSSLKKLFKTLVVGLFALTSSEAATITVSAGLPQQGLTPAWAGNIPSFTVSVGVWDAVNKTFTAFASIIDTGEVNGAFTATGPASFNGQEIAVFIGSGASIAESGLYWVVLHNNSHPSFPSDVALATGVTFAATTPGVVTIVGSGNAAWFFNQTATGYDLIPEPSSMMVGMLGLAGLLRRRRQADID